MAIERVALIYDDLVRPDTTGGYCLRALKEIVHVEHFRPTQLNQLASTQFDLYLSIDDGLRYRLPPSLHPCAWWAIDTHLDFAWYAAVAPNFDHVFVAQRDGAEQLRAAGVSRAVWLPLACDPSIHRAFKVEKQFDVGFVGNVFPGEREALLSLIRGRFPNCFIGQCYFEEMARVYSASRIVFNRSVRNDVNMRVFEALACGSVLMTNDLADNGQAELFKDGVHLVTYDGPAQLLERIEYYLARGPERERIAQIGRAEVLAKHTYSHRMRRVLTEAAAGTRHNGPAGRGAIGALTDSDTLIDEQDFPDRELLELVSASARRVLVVGCGRGRLGESLKSRQPAEVIGIEADPRAAAVARTCLDHVLEGDVERMGLDFPDESFDCVIVGDALERLRDPGRFLIRARRWLSPNGCLLTAVPNVRHHSVVGGLLAGNWTYESAGLLHPTHLHFFTRRGIERLFAACGYQPALHATSPFPELAEWRGRGRSGTVALGHLRINGLSPEDAEEYFTYRYMVRAVAADTFDPQAPGWKGQDHGLTSIVILSCNELAFTRGCVESILEKTTEPFELIFVDNGSSDGTPDYVRSLRLTNATLICNARNLGFSAGVNQGIRASGGRQILLLNNDVVVTSGWLARLLAALYGDPKIGLVGPRTSWPECPQWVHPSPPLEELDRFAARLAAAHGGQVEDVDELVGFCLLIRRETIDQIGLMDEQFGLGQCEDKDYCRRSRTAGFRNVIALDAYVHHFGHRTFVGNRIDSALLMRENKAKLDRKYETGPEPRRAPGPPQQQAGKDPLAEGGLVRLV